MAEINLEFTDAKFSDVVAAVCAQSGVSIGIVGVDLAEEKVSIKGSKLVFEDVIMGLTKSYGLLYVKTGPDSGTLRRLSHEEVQERAGRDAEVFEDAEFEDADPDDVDVQPGSRTAPGVGIDPEEVPGFRVARPQGRPQTRPQGRPNRTGQVGQQPKRRPT